jgi:hypothetical protein
MTARAWPWSAARYRTRIARRVSVSAGRGLFVPNWRRRWSPLLLSWLPVTSGVGSDKDDWFGQLGPG